MLRQWIGGRILSLGTFPKDCIRPRSGITCGVWKSAPGDARVGVSFIDDDGTLNHQERQIRQVSSSQVTAIPLTKLEMSGFYALVGTREYVPTTSKI